MNSMLIYPAGHTKACSYASDILKASGIQSVDHPAPEITHLLLDVPSLDIHGNLRDGSSLERLLEQLPPTVTVIGGNLQHPLLAGYRILDLLQDAEYLAENAAITAECALQTAMPQMNRTLRDSSVLILGWGRIGKCLGQILNAIGATVIIAVRKHSDRAMIRALGMQAVDYAEAPAMLPQIHLLFNTVPQPTLSTTDLNRNRNCLKIELASSNGLNADGVVTARGLPGLCAPESSGRLIAKRIIAHYREDLL